MSNELHDLARELPEHQPDPGRHELLQRSLVLAARGVPQVRRARPAVWLGGAALVAAAAAAVVMWRTGAGAGADHAALADAPRAAVRATAGAEFVHRREAVVGDAGAVDEVVRLTRGKLSLAVTRLRPRERMRVVVGDAEIEVRGTTFDVIADGDRLREVVVHDGLVEVVPAGRAAVMLGAGERWRADQETATKTSTSTSTATSTKTITATVASTSTATSTKTITATVASPSTSTATSTKTITATVASPSPSTSPKTITATVASPSRSPKTLTTTSTSPKAATVASPSPKTLTTTSSGATETETDAQPHDLVPPPAAAPSATETAFADGFRALRAGNYCDAATELRAAIAADPDAPLAADARYWLGVVLARAGKHEGARRALIEFLDHDPGSARAGEAAVMLGWMALQAGELDAAEARFRSATGDSSRTVAASARQGLAAVATARH